jgi:hypothetical protein
MVNLASSTEMTAASSQGCIVNPRFITSNNDGDEVGVIFSLLLKLRTDSKAVFPLVIAQ